MGKRKVIIELRFLYCQISQYTARNLEGCVCVMDPFQAQCRNLPTHESRFGITSNMTVDRVCETIEFVGKLDNR